MNKSEVLVFLSDNLFAWPIVGQVTKSVLIKPDGWDWLVEDHIFYLYRKGTGESVYINEWSYHRNQQPHSDSESVFMDEPYKPKKKKMIFIAGNFDGSSVPNIYTEVACEIIENGDIPVNPSLLVMYADKSFYLSVSMAMLQKCDEVYVVQHNGSETYVSAAKALGLKISYFVQD